MLFDLHTTLSRNLLVPLMENQWIVRPSRKPLAQAMKAGLLFRREAESWSFEQKSGYVLRRLRSVIRYARRHSPHYQRLLSQVGFDPDADFSFEDFARLPVLEREDVIANEKEMVSKHIDPNRLKQDSTGGSTGKPVRVWLGPEESGWRLSGIEFFQRRAGWLAGAKTALLWGHNLDPVANSSLKNQALAFFQNLRWFDCFRLSPEILEQYHQQMQQWQPDCIIAYAGALASLAQHVIERGYSANYPRICCITGAEKLFPRQRQLAEQAFGKVHERYGSRDVGLIAFQSDCARLDLEVDWANVLVEPESGGPASPMLVTKLNADGMPMLRYRIGDVARFPVGSLPGHPTFSISEILGRSADRIYLPIGKWIDGLQFPHMMKGYPVREFMLIQRADYSIDLQIVPTSDFGARDRESIQKTIAANLPNLPLQISIVEQVQRNKASKLRPVVSEVTTEKSA